MAHKVVFNRAQDWVDIERVIQGVPDFDVSIVDRWIVELYPPKQARRRMTRVRTLAEAQGIALDHPEGRSSDDDPGIGR